jgi:hypothetical protein
LTFWCDNVAVSNDFEYCPQRLQALPDSGPNPHFAKLKRSEAMARTSVIEPLQAPGTPMLLWPT